MYFMDVWFWHKLPNNGCSNVCWSSFLFLVNLFVLWSKCSNHNPQVNEDVYKVKSTSNTSKNPILIIDYGQFSSATPTPLFRWTRICLKSSHVSNTSENLVLITNYGQFSFAIYFRFVDTSSLGCGKMTLWLRRIWKGNLTPCLLVCVWYIAPIFFVSIVDISM
jgi:hypothetical protein